MPGAELPGNTKWGGRETSRLMNFPSESHGLSEEARGGVQAAAETKEGGAGELTAAARRVLNIELVMKTNRLHQECGCQARRLPALPGSAPALLCSALAVGRATSAWMRGQRGHTYDPLNSSLSLPVSGLPPPQPPVASCFRPMLTWPGRHPEQMGELRPRSGRWGSPRSPGSLQMCS